MLENQDKRVNDFFELLACPPRSGPGCGIDCDRGDENRPPLAAAGQARGGARAFGSGLQLVHRRIRQTGSQGGEGATGGIGLSGRETHNVNLVDVPYIVVASGHRKLKHHAQCI